MVYNRDIETLVIGFPVGHANGQCYSLGGSLGILMHTACNRVNKVTSVFSTESEKEPVIRLCVAGFKLQPNYDCKMAGVILYTYVTEVCGT